MSDEILSNLKDSGLTILQARVYVALLRSGTSKVGQLCSVSGVARPEVYRILHELMDKGLVNRNLTSPTTYTSLPAERAVSLLVEKVKATLADIERKKGPLVSALSSIGQQPGESSVHRLSLVDGSEVERLESQFLKEAKEEFASIRSKHGLAALDQPSMRAIISAKKRKLSIRILTEIAPSNVKKANYLSRFAEVRQIEGVLFYVDIYDRTRVLFGPAFLPSDYEPHSDRRELDIWTGNPRFVAGMRGMFEKLWLISREFVPSQSR